MSATLRRTPDARLVDEAHHTQRDIAKLRREREALKAENKPTVEKEAKDIDREILDLMKDFRAEVRTNREATRPR